MGEAANRMAVERVAQGLTEGNLDLFHEQFHDDSIMEYPQSGERIIGSENRRGVYGSFPQLPKVEPKELRISGDLGVLEAELDYGEGQKWKAVLTFEFRDGKIARETAYWPQPFEAAEWRAQWVERV